MLELVDGWQLYLQDDLSRNEITEPELHSRTGRPLGRNQFIEGLEQRLGRSLRKKKPGRKRLEHEK
jgi:hypothetical protein